MRSKIDCIHLQPLSASGSYWYSKCACYHPHVLYFRFISDRIEWKLFGGSFTFTVIYGDINAHVCIKATFLYLNYSLTVLNIRASLKSCRYKQDTHTHTHLQGGKQWVMRAWPYFTLVFSVYRGSTHYSPLSQGQTCVNAFSPLTLSPRVCTLCLLFSWLWALAILFAFQSRSISISSRAPKS